MNKKLIRKALVVIFAYLTAIALSLTLTPGVLGVPAMSMIRDLGRDDGVWTPISNLLELMAQAISFNQPVLLLLVIGLCWIYHRTLFISPRLNAASYAVAAFLSVATLFSSAIQETDAVSILWVNRVQLCKTALYLAGIFPLYLATFRALGKALDWLRGGTALRLRHPFMTPLWVMLLCWLPAIIARYPGALMGDTFAQMQEFVGARVFSNMNPPAHTVLVGLLMNIGYALGKPSIGCAVNMLWQVAAMLLVLSWMLSVMQELQFSRRLVIGCWGLFAFSPLYSAYATTVTKDEACAIFLLLFSFVTALLVLYPEYFWKHARRHLLLWFLSGALAILMRKNGIGIILPAGLAAGVYATIRHRKVTPLLCTVLAVVVAFGLNTAVINHFQVADGSIREVLSIPFQQTARTLREKGDSIPPEEWEAINAVLDAEIIAQDYVSYLSDPVKNTFRETSSTAHLLNYGKIWLRQFARYPDVYLDAFAGMTHSIFSPTYNETDFFTIHSLGTLYEKDGVSYNLTDGKGEYPLAGAKKTFRQIYALYLRLPVVGLTINLGCFSCLSLMLACLSWRRNRPNWLCWLPTFLTIAMLLFAPITSTRYALLVFYALPIVLMASLQQTSLENP